MQREIGVNLGNEYIANPFASQYQFFTQADIESTRAKLKYEPRWSLEDAIKDYLPAIKRIYNSEFK